MGRFNKDDLAGLKSLSQSKSPGAQKRWHLTVKILKHPPKMRSSLKRQTPLYKNNQGDLSNTATRTR